MKEQEITEAELKNNEAVEQAYKEEFQTDIPDLWNRIESALPEKAPAADDERENSEEKVNEKKIVKLRTIKTVVLIAACLCIVLMIPTILSVGGRSHSESAAAASEASMESAAEAAMPADSSEDLAAEPEMSEETATETTETIETAEDAAAQESMPETEAVADQSYDAKENQQSAVKEKAEAERNDFGSDALYTDGVRVEIIACDTERGKDDDGYITYTIMILEDASGMYELASTHDVYVDEAQTQGMKAGAKLTVTLVNPDPLSSSEPKICMLLQTE